MFSIFILLRGHDHPGGGFIGGLVAGGALALYAMTYGAGPARRALMVDPRMLVGTGLLLSLSSGLFALTAARGYLTHYWSDVSLPVGGGVSLGTTLVFDLGVYLVVAGMVSMVLFRLLEEPE